MPLCKRDDMIWGARKKFSNDFIIQNLLSKTSLGPWISVELNGVAVRCVKLFLLQQTCGGSDFSIFNLSESHFQWIWTKNSSFHRLLQIGLSKEWWKYIVLRIRLPSNKFLQGSVSPKLSKKVRGVIWNRINHFLISTRKEVAIFPCFSKISKDFHKNSF